MSAPLLDNQLRSAPYRQGGRDARGIDCLGVVLRALGSSIPALWRRVFDQWRDAGEVPPLDGCFPRSWRRIEYEHEASDSCHLYWRDVLQDMRCGDVWLWEVHEHPGCAIVVGGMLWTATPDAGVVAVRPDRSIRPRQVWRP
jgi:cell wall-associated NlpC family hydrolase